MDWLAWLAAPGPLCCVWLPLWLGPALRLETSPAPGTGGTELNDVQLRLMLSSTGPGNEDISSNFTLDLIQPEVNSLVSISQPAIRAADIKYSLRTLALHCLMRCSGTGWHCDIRHRKGWLTSISASLPALVFARVAAPSSAHIAVAARHWQGRGEGWAGAPARAPPPDSALSHYSVFKLVTSRSPFLFLSLSCLSSVTCHSRRS